MSVLASARFIPAMLILSLMGSSAAFAQDEPAPPFTPPDESTEVDPDTEEDAEGKKDDPSTVLDDEPKEDKPAKPKPPVEPKTTRGLTEAQEDAVFEIEASDELLQQEDGDTQRLDRSLESPIKSMSDAQLAEAGFVFGDSEDSRVRSTATLLALSAGLLGHGVGHWYMGDRRTAILLGSMEAAGILIFLSSGIAPMLYGADFGASSASRHLLLLGGGFFSASYVLDVVGTIQGADPLLFSNPADAARKVSGALKYGYLELNELPLRNVMRADLELDGGLLYARGRTMQDVGLTVSTYGGLLGVRPWRLEGVPGTRVEIEADVDYLQWRQRGRFERLSVVGMLGGSLDLGLLSKSLQRVVLGLKSGYMYQWYAFPDPTRYDPLGAEPDPQEWTQGLGGLPFSLWVQFDLSRRTRVRMDYSRRDGEFLHDNSPVFGVPGVQLNYRSTANLDIEVRAEYGSGVGLWGGLRVWASPKKPGQSEESFEDEALEAGD